MRFTQLSQWLVQIDNQSSRLEITESLVGLLRQLEPDEVEPVINMSLGQLKPKFDRLDFNLGSKLLHQAIAQATNKNRVEIQTLEKKLGDLGDVVETQLTGISPETSQMSVAQVYHQLIDVAGFGGVGSQEQKTQAVAKLLTQLDPISSKYVIRLILGKLRLGFSDMTVLDALSWYEVGDKSKRKELESAYQLFPDIAKLAAKVVSQGIDQTVAEVDVVLGVPIIPALAQRLKTAKEMVEKMGQVAVDPKYDGTRVQIHFRRQTPEAETETGSATLFPMESQWQVKTFTRNLDETTHMFPELRQLGQYLEADEVILDAEAIGYDPETGQLLPFQQTIQRKRKHSVAKFAKSIPLKFFVFDILYLNGRSLIKQPLSERYQLLQQVVKNSELVEATDFIVTEDPETIIDKHTDLLAQGLEGAMVKRWNGKYNPGRRGWTWVKLKEAEGSAAKLSDTIDAVVMGLYAGKGKRTDFGVGAFLIGLIADQDSDRFEEGHFYTISKVGTGLTDDQWRQLAQKSQPLKAAEKPKQYHIDKNLEPDVWLNPGLVVEIAADEITNSPIHTAEYALRFPRLIKFRHDKDVEQITSLTELKSIN